MVSGVTDGIGLRRHFHRCSVLEGGTWASGSGFAAGGEICQFFFTQTDIVAKKNYTLRAHKSLLFALQELHSYTLWGLLALSFKVCHWVRKASVTPVLISTLCNIYIGINALYWPSITIPNWYHLIVSYTDPVHSFIISWRTVDPTESSFLSLFNTINAAISINSISFAKSDSCQISPVSRKNSTRCV